jgi:hypothetical protein
MLLAAAIEEVLGMRTPFTRLGRIAKVNTEVGGVHHRERQQGGDLPHVAPKGSQTAHRDARRRNMPCAPAHGPAGTSPRRRVGDAAAGQ